MLTKDLMLALLALFIPPIPVIIKRGCCSGATFLNLILCLFGGIPAVIHAWYIILKYPGDGIPFFDTRTERYGYIIINDDGHDHRHHHHQHQHHHFHDNRHSHGGSGGGGDQSYPHSHTHVLNAPTERGYYDEESAPFGVSEPSFSGQAGGSNAGAPPFGVSEPSVGVHAGPSNADPPPYTPSGGPSNIPGDNKIQYHDNQV